MTKNLVSNLPTPAAREFVTSRLITAGLLGGAIATGLNLVVFFAARAAGIAMIAEFGAQAPAAPLPYLMVIVASVVPAFVATEVLALMNGLLARPSRLFARIAIVSAVLSLNLPAALRGADGATKVTLGLMHLIAAVSITGALLKRGRAP